MRMKHWIAFIVLGIIWSSSFMWIKIALEEIGPTTLVAFRVLFGFLFCAAIIFIQRTNWPAKFNEWWPLLFLGLINQAIPFFLISWGQQAIDSSVAAILDATVPLFTIVIAHFFLDDDKMTVFKVTGLLIGFIGVVILLSKDVGESASSVMGQAAVVLASMFYAVSGIFIRRKTQNTPGYIRSGIPLLSATFIMWPFAFITESPIQFPQLEITWISLLFLGIVGSGFAFVLAYYLIHEIGPTKLSFVTYIFPLGGVILGVVFLNEQMTWQILLGGTLIVASLAVSNWRTTKSFAKTE
ncbi:MAG: DMT family transporter [Ignavibacteriales bacterium]|nr:MAG: DMT family transporter [Ignavibacteriales bacterium]